MSALIPLGELTALPQTSWISGEGKGIRKRKGREEFNGEGRKMGGTVRGYPQYCFRSASECSATVLFIFCLLLLVNSMNFTVEKELGKLHEVRARDVPENETSKQRLHA